METPETLYSRSADGVHIAYQVLGDADLDIVLSLGFVSHLEHAWEDPSMARFLRRLASFSRLIVFDKRGTGMSDRVPDDRPALLEDRVSDIATLMDTVGSDRAALVGLSETGAVALLFAATHPERTRAAVVYGSFARMGDTDPVYPWAPDPSEAEWLEHLERNWGRGALYLDQFAPSLVGDERYEEWFAKLERLAVSPGGAVGMVRHVAPDGCARHPARNPCPNSRATQARRQGRAHRRRESLGGSGARGDVRRAPRCGSLALDRSRRGDRGDPGVSHRDA